MEETLIAGLVQGLSKLLASLVVHSNKTRNFHWNIISPSGSAIHTLLGEKYESTLDLIDDLAEHIRSFGYRPPSNLKEFLELSEIEESTGLISNQDQILNILLQDLKDLDNITSLLSTIPSKYFMQGTVDILGELSRFLRKTIFLYSGNLSSSSLKEIPSEDYLSSLLEEEVEKEMEEVNEVNKKEVNPSFLNSAPEEND